MSKYKVEPNHCNCHPETCCCNDWRVVDGGGAKVSSHFHKEEADAMAERLNKVPEAAPVEDAPVEVAPRKVIFLDVDGVLNSHRTYFGSGKLPFRFIEEQKAHFDWIAVGMLRRLVTDDPAIRFVLSSSWRIDARPPEEVAKEADAFLGLPFVGCTDTNLGCRGDQIKRWLDAHDSVEQYAIIDDDSDMLEEQAPHFVQTLFADGMRYAHFKALQRILDGKLGGLYRREKFWEDHDVPCSQEQYDVASTAGFIDNGPQPEKVVMPMEPAEFAGITIVKGQPSPEFMAAMDKSTNEWFARAARKECGWICPDCCMGDNTGMPEFCLTNAPGNGAVGCDPILVRDLIAANKDCGDVDYGFKLMDKHGKVNGTATHVLEDGDSISSICAKYTIPTSDFERWNGFQHGNSWPTPTGYVYIACPTDRKPV